MSNLRVVKFEVSESTADDVGVVPAVVAHLGEPCTFSAGVFDVSEVVLSFTFVFSLRSFSGTVAAPFVSYSRWCSLWESARCSRRRLLLTSGGDGLPGRGSIIWDHPFYNAPCSLQQWRVKPWMCSAIGIFLWIAVIVVFFGTIWDMHKRYWLIAGFYLRAAANHPLSMIRKFSAANPFFGEIEEEEKRFGKVYIIVTCPSLWCHKKI